MGDTVFNIMILGWSSICPALACRVLSKWASYICSRDSCKQHRLNRPVTNQETGRGWYLTTCACLVSLDSASLVNKDWKEYTTPCHLVPQSTRACLRLKVDAARKNQWTYADVSEIISLANLCLDCSYICILRAFRTRTVFAWLWLVAGADLLWENSTANCLLAGGWC